MADRHQVRLRRAKTKFFCLSCGRRRLGRAWRCLPGGPGDKWSIAGAAESGAVVGLCGPGLELPSAPRALLRREEVRDCGRSRQLCTAGSESVYESRSGCWSGRGSRRFGAWAVGCPLGLPWPRDGGGTPFWALGPLATLAACLGGQRLA
ncbi:hypothetical protein NDU88_002403 [Pleurodeles waltl]|uniref:Uncharacterized protein n=1 Tax=Pleurodeles waltl TaxID=8319 RepID=A0AAV7U9M1_PLEWA|nr:hypothetical protein NDU88_002403 [Pleurodeles waltl]